MVYYKLVFGIAFLPIIMIMYQLTPRTKRWGVLLIANIIFYSTFSLRRIVYPVAACGIAYLTGLLLEYLQGKKNKKAGRIVLTCGICALLFVLLHVKYTDFFFDNIRALFHLEEKGFFAPRNYLLPLGISFYTMQAIGYLADVYWKKTGAQKNPARLLCYLLFFPTVMEGPIAPYSQMKESLFGGASITAEGVMAGYLRLGWGVMKKLVIADRIAPAVAYLFDEQRLASGFGVVLAAVLFTVMEYMDFSGCMDMVCGIASIFGIELPENFKQPFLAKNASEFWRRWHISLGVWFKTYIFYPVSMSSMARKWRKFSKKKVSAHTSNMVLSAMALLPVWLCNGLWHGPKWTYVFYGIYYFVVILAELCLEPVGDAMLGRLHLQKESRAVAAVRMLKTWIIILIGELLFEAPSLQAGFTMLGSLFTKSSALLPIADGSLGIDGRDWAIVLAGLLVVLVVNLMRERGRNVTGEILRMPLAFRWTLALVLVCVILIFGLYGPGYQEVDLIYAGF